MTRARRNGDRSRIAATEAAERAAYEEADRISAECIDEMLALNRAGLTNLGAVQEQMTRTWRAGDAVLSLGPEAGQ